MSIFEKWTQYRIWPVRRNKTSSIVDMIILITGLDILNYAYYLPVQCILTHDELPVPVFSHLSMSPTDKTMLSMQI